jgi:hypothetical protein
MHDVIVDELDAFAEGNPLIDRWTAEQRRLVMSPMRAYAPPIRGETHLFVGRRTARA